MFTFQSAGISADKSQYATVGVGAIMVTMTIVTIPLMDRLGRRTLHFVSIIHIVVVLLLISHKFSIYYLYFIMIFISDWNDWYDRVLHIDYHIFEYFKSRKE